MNYWTSWSERLLRWRDRLLANPEFQRRSLRLPVVGSIARRRMRSLFDLCSGFVYSQVLLACTRLGLLELLAHSPRTAAELAAVLDVPETSLKRLLEAAESLQLVDKRPHQRFGLGSLGAALLGNPAVSMMIEHHRALYADLHDPVALLRGERQNTDLGRFWAYSRNPCPMALEPEEAAPYSDLMAASQALIADQVLSAFSLARSHRLLDVGGGAGAFALAAMKRNEHLEACVFDLPAVCDRARKRFEQAGYGARGSVHAGNFLTDLLPTGHDLVSLVRVLHDQDDEAALGLLHALRQAVAHDGLVLIAEPMLGTKRAEPVTAAYFGFYLMAMGQGRPRSADEIGTMLRQAGFGDIKEHPTAAPLLVRVLTARPREPRKS